jgi:hypothetical protein
MKKNHPFVHTANQGTLFENPFKKEPIHPDYSGTFAVNLKDLLEMAKASDTDLILIKLVAWTKHTAKGKPMIRLGLGATNPKLLKKEESEDDLPF